MGDVSRVLAILVYAAGAGAAGWQASHGGFAIVVSAILSAFCFFRLAGECALFGVSDDSSLHGGRRERVAAWLVLTRPLASGLCVASLSVAGLAWYPRGLGIVLGVIGFLVGQAFVLAGLGVLRDWRRAEKGGAAQA
jgi:hypothetical protein